MSRFNIKPSPAFVYRVNVNNIICETLHPDNIIAKLYSRSTKYNETDRNTAVSTGNPVKK